MKKIYPLLIASMIFFFACKESNIPQDFALCNGEKLLINEKKYDSITTKNYSIQSVSLDGSCITIMISSSGCDGNSWKASLFASEQESFSIPPQRSARLYLKNSEACAAQFTKNFSFRLDTLKSFSTPYIINLEGWSQPISIK